MDRAVKIGFGQQGYQLLAAVACGQIGRAQAARQALRRSLQRRIAGADDLGVGFAAALERVFDEAGDVLFVFNDEHTVFCHGARSA